MEGIKTRKLWVATSAALSLIFWTSTGDNVSPTQRTSLSEQGDLKAVVHVARGSTDHPLIRPKLVEAYGDLPLSFEANQGQTDEQVKFLTRGRGYTLFLTPTKAVLALSKPKGDKKGVPDRTEPSILARPSTPVPEPRSQTVVHMQLVGANPAPEVQGLEELPGKSNYFIGNDPEEWRTNVPNYAKVKTKNAYPGVDLVYYGNQGRLEHDFVVSPGADPKVIKLAFQGTEKVETDARGDLLLHVAGGELRVHKPSVYQHVNGEKRSIPGSYELDKKSQHVAFRLGAYDSAKPVVIDPVLSYSTYLGGNDLDFGTGIAVDSSGNAYVAGFTRSINFPIQSAAQPTYGGGFSDIFVTKLAPDGLALVYSTYVGGTDNDFPLDIVIDDVGTTYLTGITVSPNFPTATPFQASRRGPDAFVLKLAASGSALLYSTYLGGNNADSGWGIDIDSSGIAYVTGETNSPDFPVINALQPTLRGRFNAFVTKVNSTGSTLIYSTYLGGNGDTSGLGIGVDSFGNAHVTGMTGSTNFPTVNALKVALSGAADAFATKLNASGTAFLYSTYLGGSGSDGAAGITVDSFGNAFLVGETFSTDFPTVNPVQPALAGGNDAFVLQLNPAGSVLVFSTYLGGNGDDFPGQLAGSAGIALDSFGNVYVTGSTTSTNFPVVGPVQSIFGGGLADAFVTKLSPTESTLVYSTYLGGSGNDAGRSVAVDLSGNAYLTGLTSSPDFPIFIPFQFALSGMEDAFIAKIAPFHAGQGEPVPDEDVSVDYSEANWRYLVQPSGTQVPGFEQPGFSDASFSTGSAPFGSHACAETNECPLDSTATTCWGSQKTLFLRKKLFVPPGTTKATVKIRSNASTSVKVFVNGVEIGSGVASTCASELESYLFSTTNLAGTENLVAVRAENFLASAFMDVQVSFQADAQVLGPLATGSYNLGETQILSGGQVVIPFTSPGHPLAVSKQFIPFPPRAGEPNIYRVFVSNISASPATVAFVSIAVGNFGIGEALFPAGETSPNTVINPGETKQFDIVWTPWSTGHQCSRVYVGYFASDLKVMVTQWDLDVVHGIPTIDTAVNEYTVYNRFFDDRNFYLRFTQRNFPAGWTLTSSVPGPPPGSIPEEPSDPGFFATIPAKSTRIFTLTVNPNGIAGIGSVVVEGWLAFADTTACPFSQDERGAPVAQIFKNLGLGGPSDDVLCKLGFLVKTVQASAPVPDITVSPLSLSFGGVCLGSSADLSTTVTNDGGSNLVMGSVTSPALPFAIVTDTCSTQTLAPGGSCSVTVQFSPATLASFSSFFTVPSNDPDEPAVTVSLSGVGIGADIDATPNPVNFGNVSLGSFVDQAITVSNVAAACDLSISSVTAPAAPFSIVSSTCTGATLAPGDFCALTARFAPTALASFADSIGIDSNDPDENPFPVSLSGTGVNDVDLVGTWSPLGPSFCTPGGMPRARGRFQVSNAGTASSGVGFQVQVFASTDAILDPADTLVTTVGRPPCLGGSNCGGPVVIGPGAGIPCGRYLIGVADTLDQVSETNETNNVSVTATP